MSKEIFSVSSLNRYIKLKFDNDFSLKGLRLKGEISNLKRYPSGHVYFSLKDSESTITLVGPTRMDYDKALSALEYLTKELEKYFNDKGGSDDGER